MEFGHIKNYLLEFSGGNCPLPVQRTSAPDGGYNLSDGWTKDKKQRSFK